MMGMWSFLCCVKTCKSDDGDDRKLRTSSALTLTTCPGYLFGIKCFHNPPRWIPCVGPPASCDERQHLSALKDKVTRREGGGSQSSGSHFLAPSVETRHRSDGVGPSAKGIINKNTSDLAQVWSWASAFISRRLLICRELKDSRTAPPLWTSESLNSQLWHLCLLSHPSERNRVPV